jgi:chemotaxis methyl-accepting protein methylase
LVAVLLAEAGLLARSTLLGTDCRAEAIRAARVGAYDAAAARKHVPAAWAARYFEPHDPPAARQAGQRWRVRPELRAAAQWRAGDLTRVAEPGGWDLILCRNAVMYLRCDVAGRVWERLEQSLRPGGFLVLGRAERPAGATRLSPVAPCVYRRDRG